MPHKRVSPGAVSSGAILPQTARKPNFVLDDHSSRRRITAALQQPTRKFRHCTLPLGASGRCASIARKKAIELPAYLVLLRVGFTMRRRLLDVRCALTAPFHPYRLLRTGGIFSVALAVQMPSQASVPDVIRHTALRSSDFPPPANALASEAGSDHPAACSLQSSANHPFSMLPRSEFRDTLVS